LGTVYRQGNLTFSNDGYTLLSPVGNKITLFDLKKYRFLFYFPSMLYSFFSNSSSTLSIESILNIGVVALNPAGTHLFLINDGIFE
jgi:periodic tryptophan protein 2